MKHGKQHFVARSYLRAWCDPETPADQEPYVWRFTKDGADARHKPPQKIFHERDFYTIPMLGGGRDLRLERGLAGLEGQFVKIRDQKLARHQPLEPREVTLRCAFVAATQARTPTQRDHLGGFWTDVLAMGKRMEEHAKTATPEQRHAMSSLPSDHDRERSFSLEEVQAMAEQPLQTMLPSTVRTLTPMLATLDLLVFTTTGSPGFITSDNPCVWFDAEAYKRPPFYQGVGLMYPSIEITLPVSPSQLLVFPRRGPNGYIAVQQHAVDEMNRRTRAHCAEYFVTNSKTTRPIWFDLGQEPEDLEEAASRTRGQGGGIMIDLSGPLTAVSLTCQLATGGGDLTPPSYFTIAPIPAPPGARSHGGHGPGHPLHVTGSRAVASTPGEVIDLRSGAASGTNVTYTFYSAVPVTEVGTYVSDQIVDDVRFTAGLVQTWVPPTVRHHQRR